VITGRLVGDSMRVLASVATDVEDLEPSGGWFLLSIDAAGRVKTGVVMAEPAPCCAPAAIGPDGAAYAVVPGSLTDARDRSRITAFDLKGTLARFPTAVRGQASGVAFDADGNIWVLSASSADRTSRVLMVFDTGSAPLPFEAAHAPSGDTGGCETTIPVPPMFGRDGMVVLYSDVDDEIYALDRDRDTADGWPFALADPLVHPRPGPESEHEAGYCPGPLPPAIGPDGTVYLALDGHTSSAGGSLLAVGPDGKVRAGWPVGLKRPGAELWALAVGGDGTVYTIAYEPEAGGTSTATLLAIAPDSSILYRTTIIGAV
jgi:outer membrane protein assembly factor BamB